MPSGREKVLSLEALAAEIARVQREGRTVALCHGCFDILHWGHLRHFEAARALADALVVTVTPDRFVGKGPNRPVFPEDQRAELVAGLAAVDWVAVNRWPSAVETIQLLRPSLFVKGEEYDSPSQQVNPGFRKEAEAVAAIGGKVVFTREATSSSSAAVRRLALPAE